MYRLRRAGSMLAVLTVTASGLGGIAATTAGADASTVAPYITVFYAVPDASGNVTVAGLIHDTPNLTFDGSDDPHTLSLGVSDGDSDYVPQATIPNVTTNAAGDAYFEGTIPASAQGGGVDSYVVAFVGLGFTAPSYSYPDLLSNYYPVGPDNTAWQNALEISINSNTGTGSTSGVNGVAGESRWYKVAVAPDQSITVNVNNYTPGDPGLSIYKDISQLATPPASTDGLNTLSAQFAADTFSPSAYIPSAYIPSAYIPSAYIPSAYIPSAYIPSAYIPSAYIPSNYSPSAYIPSAYIASAQTPGAGFSSSFPVPPAFAPPHATPSAFQQQTYSSAVTQSLLAYGNTGSSGTVTLTANTYQATTWFYIQVSSREDGSDYNTLSTPFTLSVNNGTGSCSPSVQPVGSAPAAQPAGNVKTVIVTDSSLVPAGTPAETTDMLSQLQTMAARPEVGGVVVDLASNSRVKALETQAKNNPGCVYAENLVAGAIRDVISSYRANNPLAYVVLAGSDAVIPFFRHPDQTLMGNERGYNPPLANLTPAAAALQLGYDLSDNDYGARVRIGLKTDSYPVPDLAVGRLVESAAEISGMVQDYLNGADSTGTVLKPSSSLVTGYDFLTYAANQVEGDFSAGVGGAVGTVDSGAPNETLIEDRSLKPTDPTAWNGAALRHAVLSKRHDLVFLAGHFSANDALAADYTTDMLTTDLEQSSVNLQNSLVLSAGCHSGYNIVDGEGVSGVTLGLDWPEAFARKGATLIGGTGYQYGDTDFVAYSEQIDADFAHQLRYGTGGVPIGQALLKAKQDYLDANPDLDAIQQKAVLEVEEYGLPFASVNLPNGRLGAAPTDTSVVVPPTTASGAGTPGAALALTSADVTVTPTLHPASAQVTNIGNSPATTQTATYYTGTTGAVSIKPYQPVLPLESTNVSVAKQAVRGALFLGGHYSDESDTTPLTGAPATDLSGVASGFSSSVWFPEKFWTVNTLDALDGADGSATHLLVTPVQHRTEPDGSITRRVFDSSQYRLYYSSSTSTAAAAAAPSIVQVQARPDAVDPTLVDVCATIGGDPTAGVQDAVATWTDGSQSSGSWSSVHLTPGGCSTTFDDNGPQLSGVSGAWGGTIGVTGENAANVQFLLQAVSGVGLVSVDDDFGAYYSLPQGPALQCGSCYLSVDNLSVTSGPVTAGATVTLSATLDDTDYSNYPNVQTSGVSGQPVVFTVGSQSVTAVTTDGGTATASLTLAQPPGTYTVTGTFAGDADYYPASPATGAPLTVVAQPTALSISPITTGLANGETSFYATLCPGTCTPGGPVLANRSVEFSLTGPTTKTVVAITDVFGRARFDAYGLTPGGYALQAQFGGLPGLPTDPSYGSSSSSTTFSTSTPFTAPPTLSLPAVPPVVTATTAAGAVVTYAVGATDPVDPHPSVSCTPASVTLFPVGATRVSCTAKDTAGNTATGSFTVTVNFTSPTKPLSAGTTACNGTYSGKGAAITVAAGATCVLLQGTQVTGNVTVASGGALKATGVSIGGNLAMTGPGSGTAICGSTVVGDVTLASTTAGTTVPLGNPGTGCAADSFGHDLKLTGNAGAVTISGLTLVHDLTVSGGSGSFSVTGSTLQHDVNVTGNSGAVTVSGNKVTHDFNVTNNKPGGVTVSGNTVGHNATCTGNTPLTGSGNTATGTSSCPR